MPRMQKEVFPWQEDNPQPSTPEEVFEEEDRKRLVVTENKCRCPFEMVYIPPPPPPPRPPPDIEEQTPIEIVSTPPALVRVCACATCSRPRLPELQQPVCLQFIGVPLRTVRTRTLQLRNESVVTAHWSTALRRHARLHSRTLDADEWASGVRAAGVALACVPARGVLAARACTALAVRVYADCWGLYHDQLLIQIAGVAPVVLDVWVEALGPPLQLALRPAPAPADRPPTMWVSAGERRVLRVRNTSRSALALHVYSAAAHEYAQDTLPFRLYLRYYDVPLRTCACVDAFQAELMGEQSDTCSFAEEVETGFEIYFAPDFGVQNDDYYAVSPEVCTLAAGASAEWAVTAREPPDAPDVPDVHLLLRTLPLDRSGPGWYRREPPPQLVRVRRALRYGRLKLSCCKLRVTLCALDLPYGDVLRVRKRFHAINVGNGVLELGAETQAPWCLVSEREAGGAGGAGTRRAARRAAARRARPRGCPRCRCASTPTAPPRCAWRCR
nr:uncharacterized protein LOC110383233 [Helicoverpa armigera]